MVWRPASITCAETERIGASADAILAELGYSPDDIANLRDSGVVIGTEWTRAARSQAS